MNNGTQYGYSNSPGSSNSSNLTDAVVDTMVRWPMRMTGATVDFMIRGMQSMTGTGRSGGSSGSNTSSSSSWDSSTSSSGGSSVGSNANSGWSSIFSNQTSGTFDQDLSGDDLKYVIWSILFTKPGYECILQKQQEELVNYAADASTFAAVKIARFLDSARHGHADRPEGWRERGYPFDAQKGKANRKEKESTTVITTPGSTTIASSMNADSRTNNTDASDKGWRIPSEDQKYISFVYRVERRIPKQEETTRVERVTVERGTRVV